MLLYDLKCPRCGERAWAQMIAAGVAGTYREVTRKMAAARIGCDRCGLVREPGPAHADDYELWFRGRFKGHVLWARNQHHLEFLIDYLASDMDRSRLAPADQAYVECLPRWLISHHREALRALRLLRRRLGD